jgi:hypothetical protein
VREDRARAERGEPPSPHNHDTAETDHLTGIADVLRYRTLPDEHAEIRARIADAASGTAPPPRRDTRPDLADAIADALGAAFALPAE